jgi:YD repeat-containing protein
MNKHHTFSGFVMAIFFLAIYSCSKPSASPNVPTPAKRLVEVWHNKGQAGQSGFKYQYDDQGRMVKRSDALDATSYESWTYNGTAITNHKAYSKGVLVYDLDNSFSTSNGSVFETFIHKDGTGSVTDTTILQYDVSGRHITFFNVIIKFVGGRTVESGYQFTFVGDEFGAYVDRSAENGVVNSFHSTVILTEHDFHLNPFYDMGPMNQILSSYADDWLSKGYHNTVSLAGPQIGADPAPGKYVWTYDADSLPVSMKAEGSTQDLLTYVYSR